MHIVVLTPHGGDVPPEYYRHILGMQAQPQHAVDQFTHIEVDIMIVGKARNMLVDTALTTEGDVFLFVDNDTLIPPHAGVICTQAMEYGIVSGLYFSRRPPYTPQAYMCAPEAGLEGLYWPILEYPPDSLMVVDAVGGGCLAVRRDIYIDIRDKHLARVDEAIASIKHSLRNKGEERRAFEWLMTYAQHLSPWFEFLDKKGEDLYFCERAREYGHVIWLNTGVKAAHLGAVPLNESNYMSLYNAGLIKKVPVGGAQDQEGVRIIGAEDTHGHSIHTYPGTQTMERRYDIPGPTRRIGVSSGIPSSVIATERPPSGGDGSGGTG